MSARFDPDQLRGDSDEQRVSSWRRLRAEVYLRAYTPMSEPQTEILDRLERLVDEGTLADVDVEYVPRSVRREGAPTAVERLYDRCTGWAADHGVSIDRPFTVREWENPVTGETVEKLATPIVTLLCFDEDDQLRAVLPCDDGDGTVTVRDYLTALEDGGDPLGTRPRIPTAAPLSE